jgi:hypothetical protein
VHLRFHYDLSFAQKFLESANQKSKVKEFGFTFKAVDNLSVPSEEGAECALCDHFIALRFH